MEAIDAIRMLRRYLATREGELLRKLRTTDKIEHFRGALDENDLTLKKLNELLQTGEPPPGSDFDDDEDETDRHRPIGRESDGRKRRATAKT